MRVKEIYASVKFTANLGNYQSFVAEAGVHGVVEPLETETEAFDKAFALARTEVRKEIAKVLKNKGEV